MIMTEEEINEQLELEQNIDEITQPYTKEEIQILYGILTDSLDKSITLDVKQIDDLLSILRFLEINNGIVNSNMILTLSELDRIHNKLCILKSTIEKSLISSDSKLADVSNFDVEDTKKTDGILTEDEKNILIASYDRCDISIFAIKLKDLRAMYMVTSDYAEDNYDKIYFPHGFSYRLLTSLEYGIEKELDEIGEEYTLIKYLGNNKFEEFYTGKKITLYRDSAESMQTFLTKFNDYIENPLCIVARLNDLEIATSEIENKVIANAKDRRIIESFINRVSNCAKKALVDMDLARIIDNDYLYAKEEDRIYEFKKIMK